MRDATAASGDSRLEHGEMVAFSGWSTYAEGVVMVCPELLDHVKNVVEKDAAILKKNRKARDERLERAKKK